MHQEQLDKIKARICSLKGDAAKNAKIVMAFTEVEAYEANAGLCRQVMGEYPHAKLLSLNYFLSKHLEETQVKHDHIYSETMGEEHADLNEASELLAQNWYRDKNIQQDFTQYDGLSLGSCLEFPTLIFFQMVLKCATDIEVYLKGESPDVLVFFNTGRPVKQLIEVAMDFNVFDGLLPLLCRKSGVGLMEIASPVVLEKKVETLFECFTPAPPVTIFGMTLRVPKFLYPPLKYLFLIIKNIVARKQYCPDKPNIFIVSATTFNYLGSNLVNKIMGSKKFNLSVWAGESKEAAITNILPCFSPTYWNERLGRSSLVSKFKQQFHADHEKLKQATEYKGFSIFELYPFFFEKIYASYFPDLVIHARLVRNYFKKNDTKAIISHSDHSVFERMALLVGNSLSIPTICIQHGLEEPMADTRLGYPGIACHYFVWGKVNKEFRIAKGVDARRIEIVGCFLHEFVGYGQKSHHLSLDSPGTFLFISNSGGQGRVDNRMSFTDNEQQIRLMLETMKSFPHKKLVIKPRFHDLQMRVYQKLIRDSGVTNAVIDQTPIVTLLNECDLFFCIFSTAALEGMILCKPGIQFLFVFNGKKPVMDRTGTVPTPFTKYGALLGIETPDADDLKKCIHTIYQSSEENRLRLNEGRIKFLEDYANLGHGEPTENFIKALEKCALISNNK